MNHIERIKAIEDECSGVWGQSGVTSWEREFLENVKQHETITERQEATLEEIERKVFGAEAGEAQVAA